MEEDERLQHEWERKESEYPYPWIKKYWSLGSAEGLFGKLIKTGSYDAPAYIGELFVLTHDDQHIVLWRKEFNPINGEHLTQTLEQVDAVARDLCMKLMLRGAWL